jgi:anti-sigma regulatory factor (Ser/Thr protein kinase)
VPRRVSLELELASSIDAAAEARRALDRVGDELPGSRMRDVRLLVSELVTNAVRHAGIRAGDPIHMLIDVGDGRMRVEIADSGSGFEPRPPEPDPTRASGWGLVLVAELADRWGVEPGDPGTRIWFEVDR